MANLEMGNQVYTEGKEVGRGGNRRGSSACSVATGVEWGGDACVVEVSSRGEEGAEFGDPRGERAQF